MDWTLVAIKDENDHQIVWTESRHFHFLEGRDPSQPVIIISVKAISKRISTMPTPWLEDWTRCRPEVSALGSSGQLDDDASGMPSTTTTIISSSDAGTDEDNEDNNINIDNANAIHNDKNDAFLDGTIHYHLGPAASDDLDLILQHVDFPLLLSLAAQVKAVRDGQTASTLPDQQHQQQPHQQDRDKEIADAVQRIQARLLSVVPSPPQQHGANNSTTTTATTIPIIERGQYPITDAVIDDALVELQSELDRYMYGCRSSAMDSDPRCSPRGGPTPYYPVGLTSSLQEEETTVSPPPSSSAATMAETCPSSKSNKSTAQPSDSKKTTKGEAIAIKYSKWQTDILMGWMIEHSQTPFPEASDIAYLALQTGLTHSQVVNWTTNVRKRNLKATCRGSKKPHHFIDFLFLKQDREARAAGKEGRGLDGKANSTPPAGNHGNERPNTTPSQSSPPAPPAPTTTRLHGRDDVPLAIKGTRKKPLPPPPPSKHRQVSPSYKGRDKDKPDRRRVRSESPQRQTGRSIHWDAATALHPDENPIDETRDDKNNDNNDNNDDNDESSACHTLLTEEIWEPLDWKDETNPDVLQHFADYWKYDETLVHEDRWVDCEGAETHETDGPGSCPVVPRSYHRGLALLPSVTRDSHEDDWTLRAVTTTTTSINPVAPSNPPLAMPPPVLDDDFWYKEHCDNFPCDHHPEVDGKSREDFPFSWWEMEDSGWKLESV